MIVVDHRRLCVHVMPCAAVARTHVPGGSRAYEHRNVIHEVYLSGSDIPGADNWGCEVEKPSRFVERIRTDDAGVIKLTLGNEIGDLRLAIHDITLAPLNGSGIVMREEDLGTPVRRWRCGASADGTDVKSEFLPSSCRG
jgi:type IV pilus assembly protein PilA